MRRSVMLSALSTAMLAGMGATVIQHGKHAKGKKWSKNKAKLRAAKKSRLKMQKAGRKAARA